MLVHSFSTRLLLWSLVLSAHDAFAQFIHDSATTGNSNSNSNSNSRNLTVVPSPANPNITVSYKIPDGVCTTAFATQKQYTGWVNVPGDYPTNLFFWFVEAREKTDGLTIWLNGGPGSSSLYGFFTGNGPCEVVEKGLNEFETAAREWGWDRASNMLFIDQPNQVGFSYDVPTNGSISFSDGSFNSSHLANKSDNDFLVFNGTFGSGNSSHTANTTQTAALAVWHMIQGFLTTFPQYHPTAVKGSIGINLFAESYGGRYGPVFAETFEGQNTQRLIGQLPRNTTVDVRLNSLGIVNGCIDRNIEIPLYPSFASSNSYGLKALDRKEAEFYQQKYSAQGGCRDLLAECLAVVDEQDPNNEGNSTAVNVPCAKANTVCNEIQAAYYGSGRSPYDIAASSANPFPPLAFLEYLNHPKVQKSIGAPINYTMNSRVVQDEFLKTGDIARDGNIPRLAALLNRGIRVGLIYGDRDYICNWRGGEAVSKSIALQAGLQYGKMFNDAGYAPIIVNDSYIGGVVRQYGNLSFSRVYQAGHAVSAYQPETAFQVFARIIMGTSVSTGEDINLTLYNTSGSANATHEDNLPKQPESTCYIRAFSSTCDADAQKLINDGKGVVINGILYKSSEEWSLLTEVPSSTTTASASTTGTLTGVFTATSTPDSGARQTAPRSSLVVLFISFTLCATLGTGL